MILLHHTEVELSRTLLGSLPADASIVDCTNGVPDSYTGPQPSAFPSVVFTVPAKTTKVPQYGPDGGLLGVSDVTIPEHQDIIRLPSSWDAVNAYISLVIS